MNNFRVNRVNLEKLELSNYDDSKKIDISNIVQEFNLHEDFMQITMYGNVVIYDSLDLIQELPIIGEETIDVSFSFQSAKEDISGTKIKRKFRVYKASDIQRSGNDKSQSYILHFISPEYYKNIEETVPNSYTDSSISSMVKSIYDNYIKIDNKKIMDIEKTKSLQNIIIPFLYPFQAINMLAKRAWSSDNKSSNYIFYEDRDGFHFKTIESFLDQESKQEYYYRQSLGQSQNVSIQDKNYIEPFIIRNLVIVQLKDNLKHLIDQMYNSSIDTIDILAKTYETDSGSYKYDRDFKNFKHLHKNPIKSDIGTFFNNDSMYYPTNKKTRSLSYTRSRENIKPKNWESFLPQKRSAFAQLDTIVLEVTIPGDHLRKPGDVIDFNLPSATDLEELQGLHRYLSGRYLVTRVRHKINTDSYSTVMQIVKESFPKKIKPLEA